MKKLLLFCFLLIGCGTSSEQTAESLTTSRLGSLIHHPFNEHFFLDNGKTGEYDAWGSEIIWDMEETKTRFILTVRSCGPDKLPYTDDDQIIRKRFAKDESSSELFVKGIVRGYYKGKREGNK